MKASLSKQQCMQKFIAENYISLTALAKHYDVTEVEILAMENSQCIPGHTYEIRQIYIFTCAAIDAALTENSEMITTHYYHHSVSSWAEQALPALKNSNLTDVAAQVKNNFAAQLSKVLEGKRTPGCQSFDQAWAYWIDGTWGKCLKEISFVCLAKKELARFVYC